MGKRKSPHWTKSFQRALDSIAQSTVRVGTHMMKEAVRPVIEKHKKPPGPGEWITGLALGPTGMRRYYLYRPSGIAVFERLPLLVMLHGCRQDAKTFAHSTRMNQIAARERFFVLYPEQDRLANPQGCWNWFETRSGKAYGEAAILSAAIDQVCLFYPIDRDRIAIAGMSAGASMGALLVTRNPARFKAVVMHSGVAPGTAHSSASVLGAMLGAKTPAALSAKKSWPPLLVIHGGKDHVVDARNALASAQVWAEAAGARAGTVRRVRRGNRHEMMLTDFKVKGSTIATLCEVGELGHAWSGGHTAHPFGDAEGPDASRMVWAFAARQFEKPAAGRPRSMFWTRF